jgi:molybdate transport system substrate-binding protein
VSIWAHPVLRSLVAIVLLVVPARAQAPDVRVAAASDLQAALPSVIARFQKETGVRVQPTFGSSGNFFTQLQNGAPFDVFLSADIEYPRRLQAAGLGEGVVSYGTGRLVLWTRRDSGIDVTRGLDVVLDPRVKRIAIANPKYAPYGRAAVAALESQHVYEKVRDRLVFGENIAQAVQFAQSGNADVGIIALALAVGPALKASGTYVEIPASLHPPIEQGAIVLKSARDSAAARRFVAFLGRRDTVDYLKQAGFEGTPSRRSGRQVSP